jgi:hypothetical protein
VDLLCVPLLGSCEPAPEGPKPAAAEVPVTKKAAPAPDDVELATSDNTPAGS